MDVDAFETVLETFRERIPFKPMVIELENGKAIEIKHPESLIVQRGTVGEDDDEREVAVCYYIRTFDAGVHIFETSAITQIRDVEQPVPA